MKSRVYLRNKIAKFIAERFGVKIDPLQPVPPINRGISKAKRFGWRFVRGTAKDGRTVLIYPCLNIKERIPQWIYREMIALEERGAIVGTAENIGDSFEIVIDNEAEYPRKAKTRFHQYWKNQGDKNG